MNRDELVEHLHNEIASRDERIGELENEASYYASRYEDVREELEALKAANLDLQIHFNTMKAELEEVNSLYIVIPEREDYEDDRKQPNSWTDYAIGWNACRRETKRLNSDKETK